MGREKDRKFLNRYFRSVYNKLEADALLFNRRLPHEGLKGSENEQALADILRNFLPAQYGIEANGLIIDRDGAVSRQCDIIIYDDIQFPKYFRKVYPIETVYAVVEVKTELSKQQVDIAIENEAALRKLQFRPLLTPYWQTTTKENKIPHSPPFIAYLAIDHPPKILALSVGGLMECLLKQREIIFFLTTYCSTTLLHAH